MIQDFFFDFFDFFSLTEKINQNSICINITTTTYYYPFAPLVGGEGGTKKKEFGGVGAKEHHVEHAHHTR